VYLVFAMSGASGQGTSVKGRVAPVLASEAANFGKFSMTSE